MSTAETLETIAVACATVADKVNDTTDLSEPWTLKQINLKGRIGFRFTQIVVINGEEVEVQVRKVL